MAKAPLEWMNVNPDEIKDPKVKEAWKARTKASEAFEVAFQKAARENKSLDDGQELIFAYRRGQIGIAKKAKGTASAAFTI